MALIIYDNFQWSTFLFNLKVERNASVFGFWILLLNLFLI